MRVHTGRMGMAGVGTASGRLKCLSSAALAARSAGAAHPHSRSAVTVTGRTTGNWIARDLVGYHNLLTMSALFESTKPNANASVRERAYDQSEVPLSEVAGYYVVTVMPVLAQSSGALEMNSVGTLVGCLAPDLEDNCFHCRVEKGMWTV